MKSHYTMFAGYNAWANRRLYDAAALLADADYRADRARSSSRCTARSTTCWRPTASG